MTDDDRRLAQRLRAYEGSVPETPMPTTTSFSRRPPWIGIAAVGAAAVLAGAFIAGNLVNEPNVGESEPTPSVSAEPTASASSSPSATPDAPPGTESPTAQPTVPTATPAPEVITGVAWDEGAGAIEDGTISRVTADGGRFYALGSMAGRNAAIWSSPDGMAWERASLPFPSEWPADQPGFVSADELASVGGRLVAIGEVSINDYLEVVVWGSTDGMTWSEVDTGDFRETAFNVLDVTNGPGGLVAVSHHYGQGSGSAWRSADGGTTWTEHRPPGDGITLAAAVGTSRGYLVAGGVNETYDNEMTSSPRIWYSSEGTNWQPASVEGSGGRGLVEQLTIDGSGRWVAIGVLNGRVVVWHSTDRGLSWTVTADLGAAAPSTRSEYWLAGAPDGFIAISRTDAPVTWTSPDGTAWTRGDAMAFDPSDESFIDWARGIARVGDTLVVGARMYPTEGNPPTDSRIWVGTIQR